MQFSVHLVTWNGAKYIPYIFDSLRQQSNQNFELFVYDNASIDGTPEALQQELRTCTFPYTFLQNDENIGFVGGHNAIYKEISRRAEPFEYIVCLNQDMYLEKNCFEKLLVFMDEHSHVASIAPRIMKWNFAPLENNFQYAAVGVKGSDDKNNNLEIDFFLSDIIDTLGLKVFRSRRVIDQHVGENWEQLKEKFQSNFLEVFGVSGACPMYRKSALDKVVFDDGTMFDTLYHSYKEDVDLAFRLNLAGYKSYVHLNSVVYHDRSAAGNKNLSDLSASKNKKMQSNWVKYNSYKNQLMTLLKNETAKNFILDFPFILWYEMEKFGWFLLFDRSVLRGLKEIWVSRTDLKQKRRSIQSKKVSNKTLRKWLKK